VTQHAPGPRNPSVVRILENYGSLLKALGGGEEAAQTYALARAARSHGMEEVAEHSLSDGSRIEDAPPSPRGCLGVQTADKVAAI